MSKRRIKKRIRTVFSLLVLVLLAFGAFKAYQYYTNKQVSTGIPVIKEEEKETWPKTYKVSLLATGDGLIHNTLYDSARLSDGSYDFKPMLTEIKDIVKSYDIAYYNQETVFGGASYGYKSYPIFNTPSEYGDAMIDAGFNMVSLASNHSMDMGKQAALNSVSYWETTDVLYNGMAKSEEERNNFIIKEKNNITYGMLSYTYGTNGINVPSDMPYLVNIYSDDVAKKDIEALRDKVDVLIVAMHWGNEYQLTPSSTQKEQAKYLASLGVDIIIGNHSHSLQPIETIDNTLVIYSLGNFISNQGILEYSRFGYGGAIKGIVGAFVYVDIVKTLNKDQSSTISLDNLKVELIYTYRSNTKEFKVVPFSKMNENYKSNYKEVYESYKKVVSAYDSTLEFVPCN